MMTRIESPCPTGMKKTERLLRVGAGMKFAVATGFTVRREGRGVTGAGVPGVPGVVPVHPAHAARMQRKRRIAPAFCMVFPIGTVPV